jgi:integrase
MRCKLTDKKISALQPPKAGRFVLSDSLERGLDLRITPDDRRTWSIRCWVGSKDDRKQRRVTLGGVRESDGAPTLSLAQARQAARDVKIAAASGQALKPGDGIKDAMTWAELGERYIAAAEGGKLPKGELREKTLGEIRRRLRRSDFAEWNSRPAARITSDDVRALRDEVAKRGPIESRQFVNLVNTVGTWAVEEGLLPVSPAAGVKRGPRAEERERTFDKREIGAFLRGCDRLDFPYRQIGWMLMLTCLRLREVAHAEWGEFDFAARTWTIPGGPTGRTKNKKPLTLHLSAPAFAILLELREQRQKVAMLRDSPYLFTTTGRKLTTFSDLKDKLDAAMAEELGETPAHWGLHDTRRSGATLLAALDVAPHIIEKILGHSKAEMLGGPVARIYNKHPYLDQRKDALELLGQHATALAGRNVVPLRRA